ncbi:dicarboxylate/amino acid:cation symporter, partial [Streptomyces sp. AA8]
LATRTLMWFMITSLIAVVIGLGIGLLTDPGAGTGLTAADGAEPKKHGSWIDFLTGIVPTDIVTPFTELKVLQIVFMAVVVGVAILKVGEKAQPVLTLSHSVLELLQKALWWVIKLAPLGTLGLVGTAISTYGWNLLSKYATFTADIYVGCAIVMFGVYPLLLAGVAKVNPLQFFKGAWPAIQLAFVSRSSVGTMPLTQKVTERLGVPKEYASFAVPFGSTTKMDGCASIYPAIAAIFVAQVFDVPLEVKDYILIAFVSVIGSAATAGLTGATVMLTLTLSTLGLPMAGVGLLLAIDPIVDMMRTATNVAGQSVVPILVASREGILDRAAYATADGSHLEDGESRVDAQPQPVAA